MVRRTVRLLLVCSLVLLISPPNQAVDRPAFKDPRTLEPTVAAARSQKVVPDDGSAAGAAAGRFLRVRGGEWSFDGRA